MTMSKIREGVEFRVLGVSSGGETGKRLADMGFTNGATGCVVRKGFFKGPLQVRLRGYDILIRSLEADAIDVEPAT